MKDTQLALFNYLHIYLDAFYPLIQKYSEDEKYNELFIEIENKNNDIRNKN